MTNEDKALEIAKQHKLNYNVRYNGITYTDSSEAECCNSAMDMAQWKDEQVKQTREDAKSLYNEISDCIDRLIKSRLSKNGIGESNALQQMESIMVKTQQFLTYINEL